MPASMTVEDVLARVSARRRRKRCPDCDGVVSIRGFRGEYHWTCLDCEAVGIGFATRSDALEAAASQRRDGTR